MRHSLFVICAMAWCAGAFGAAPPPLPNLAGNPGFEDAGDKGLPARWGGQPGVYSRDTSVHHSGTAALKYSNNDSGRYLLCTQPVALEPGMAYELSVWVKTEDVKGGDSGATICLEWSDKNGKYLGGCYPAGFKGTTDWRQIKALTGRVPPNAARCSVSCYLRKTMTGTAWWDDVSVVRYRAPALETVLRYPHYRGQFTDDKTPAKVRAYLNLADYNVQPADVRLDWTLTPQAGAELQHGTAAVPAAETEAKDYEADLTVPLNGTVAGDYNLTVTLVNKRTGTVLGSSSHQLHRLPDGADRGTYIDAHNRLIVDGKPFFPLGMYWSGVTQADLDTYADSPFNCLMPYGAPSAEQMDWIQAHGLKVIYSVKDIYSGTTWCPKDIKTADDEHAYIEKKVAAFKDHPALLAWYLNDELPPAMVPRLAEHQRWMEQLDPGHPTWVVLYEFDQVRRYIDTFDVIGTDPYPIPGRPAAMAGEWARTTEDETAHSRPVWMVPQVFNHGTYAKTPEARKGTRPPTLAEMRSMAWQCITAGANGLIFYSFFDIKKDTVVPFAEQWTKVKQMAAEIKAMTPVLLSVDPAPEIVVEPTPGLQSLVKQKAESTYVILVNDSPTPVVATVRFPRRPSRLQQRDGGSVLAQVTGDSRFSATLPPFDVQIYRARF